jgi:hypothetical protein
MMDNPLSVALPPSPPTAASFTNTGIKDVSITEKNTKIGQEMNEFMSDVDSFDQDSITPHFDSHPSPTLPFAKDLHDTGIKDTSSPRTTTKNGPKVTAFLREDDPTSQDDTTLLSDAHFDKGRSPIPLIAAFPKDNGIEDVFMTEMTTRKGQKLTNFLLDNAPNHFNKITRISDTHFDSASMPPLPNDACGINTNIKNASMDRNVFKNGQTMMDSTTDNHSTNLHNNTPFSLQPLDSDMDDQSMLAPSHMKRAHCSQNNKKQIDIRMFGKELKGQVNNKKTAPVKQSIPYMCINDIISDKKSFPHLSINKTDTWVMDDEEVSILPEQVTPKQLHSSNKLAYSYTSDSDETMQSHDQDAIMERCIPVSSKKKRSKQAQKSDNGSDHTEADPWQSTPEQLDYPQPVSKRISIGIPTNPYVISKEKAIATKNTQQTHTNDSNSVKTAKRSGQDGLEGDITQSYLRLAIDCSSDSVSDKHTFQTIRSIIKIILRSKEGLTIIPPTSQEVPVIKENLELPGRENTRLMRRYIH